MTDRRGLLIYQLTSVGRPLEPAYATNRAVRILMPLAGVVGGAVAGIRGLPPREIVVAACLAVAVTLGSWALGRELAPDHPAAAFVGMALALIAHLLVEPASVWLLFTALVLARVVNRTVGPPARLTDSLLIAGLTLGCAYQISAPLLGLAGAVAFVCDATLVRPQRTAWIFAGLCIAGTVVLWPRGDLAILPTTPPPAVLLGIGLLTAVYLITIVSTRRVSSTADLTEMPLDLARVRGGMLVALLVALAPLVEGAGGVAAAALVWATLGASLHRGR